MGSEPIQPRTPDHATLVLDYPEATTGIRITVVHVDEIAILTLEVEHKAKLVQYVVNQRMYRRLVPATCIPRDRSLDHAIQRSTQSPDQFGLRVAPELLLRARS